MTRALACLLLALAPLGPALRAQAATPTVVRFGALVDGGRSIPDGADWIKLYGSTGS